MVLLPSLNIDISPFTFLLARNEQCQDRLMVCQLIEAPGTTNVVVSWWLDDDMLLNLLPSDSRASLNNTGYSNVVKCAIKEVTKQANSFTTIQLSCIVDVAFVFHPHDLEYKWVDCAGMKSVFFTRYELDSN